MPLALDIADAASRRRLWRLLTVTTVRASGSDPCPTGLPLALGIVGAASRRRLRRLSAVTAVRGWAAAAPWLLGAVPSVHPVLDFIDPAPGARRAGVAWRVGRLRSALPLLAGHLMADVDR